MIIMNRSIASTPHIKIKFNTIESNTTLTITTTRNRKKEFIIMPTHTTEESQGGIHLSEMTADFQGKVEKLGIDKDGDGKIDRDKIQGVIDKCK